MTESVSKLNTRARLATVLAVAMLGAGCASYSGIEPQSKIAAAPDAALTAGSPGAQWPAGDWWQSFKDPVLDRLVGRALANQPTLRIAQARVRRAQADVAAASAELMPSLDTNESAVRQRFSANGYFPAPIGGGTYTVYQGTLDFHYEFDFWHKNRDALEAALSAAGAAQADADAARLVLASGIASTYFQLRYALEQSAIAHEALDRRQQLLKLTQDRTASGLESEVSVRQAQAEVEQAQVDIVGADRTVQLLRNQLAALLGAGPQATADTGRRAGHGLHTATLPHVVPADLLGRRPDIAASRARVEAAAARIGVAKAQFMPNINLAASLGLQSIDLGTLLTGNSRLFSFGPALSLPIFEGGRLRANLKASDAEYDIAVEQYNQAVIDAVREAADAITNYRHATHALAPEDAAVDATRQAYQLTLSRYKSGLNNYLSVLIAENKLLERRSARAQLAARQVASLIDIYKALGGGYTAPSVAAAH